ncbi:MAG: sensor histidine kinase [Spirochaetota bacterium]
MRRPSWFRERAPVVVAWLAQLVVLVAIWLLSPALRGAWIDLGYALLLIAVAGAAGLAVDFARFRIRWRRLASLPEPPVSVDRSGAGRERGAEESDAVIGFVRARDEAHGSILELREEELEENVEFFGAWVHELKTPVSVLRLTTADSEHAGALRRQLDRIETNLDRAMFFLRGSSLSRDLFVRTVDLAALAAERVASYREALTANELSVSTGAGAAGAPPVEVTSDPKWLAFVVDQLLQNAIRYTPPGGTISVTVTTAPGDAPSLTVADTGPGIPESELPRVFDRGFTGTRGREHGGSTGMGLYLARKLAVRLGHEITVSAPATGGTRVTVVFPRWSERLL